MTKTEAEKKMLERRRRCARKRGPMSLAYTAPELLAITVLASTGRTHETVARDSGLTLAQFAKALKEHELLSDAWLIGKAIRREQRIDDLEKQSKKGSTRACELLLKYEHRDIGPQTGRQAGTDITVNVNHNSAPSAIDGRSHAATMRRIQKDRAPVTIEHQKTIGPPVILDPIASVKQKQLLERKT